MGLVRLYLSMLMQLPSRTRTTILLLTVATAIAATVLGLWRLSDSRRFQLFGRIVPRVATDQRVVALTLDDGPNPKHTDEVLTLLRNRGVRATFFLTGQETVQHPEIARAIVADGHELGNHSFTHRAMLVRSPSSIRREVERTDSALRAIGYEGPIHFRPPFGKKLLALPWYLSRTGRTTVMWDIEPESDPAVAATAASMVDHVLQRVRPGSIVLLHVMYDSRARSRAALGPLIDSLQSRDYRFVTVSELLQLAQTGQ